ncbi:MAG: hypothetical protein R3D30_07150 [Hyphomicrobiales bacterium]
MGQQGRIAWQSQKKRTHALDRLAIASLSELLFVIADRDELELSPAVGGTLSVLMNEGQAPAAWESGEHVAVVNRGRERARLSL